MVYQGFSPLSQQLIGSPNKTVHMHDEKEIRGEGVSE